MTRNLSVRLTRSDLDKFKQSAKCRGKSMNSAINDSASSLVLYFFAKKAKDINIHHSDCINTRFNLYTDRINLIRKVCNEFSVTQTQLITALIRNY